MKQNNYYISHKPETIARRVAMRRICTDYLIGVKSRPCHDCGIQYPYYVMQFDHLLDKEFTLANRTYYTSIKRLEKEVAKCDVVCANCHAERTWQRAKQKTVDKE